MENLTNREKQVLIALIKNARVSDQYIAQELGTSRPTVAKIRKRLEKKYIRQYSAYIDFHDIGLDVLVITLFRWDDFSKKKEMNLVFNFIKTLPFVLRFSNGVGVGSMTMALVSVHENFESYEKFWEKIQEIGKENIREVQAFISSTKDMHKKHDYSSVFINYLSSQKMRKDKKNIVENKNNAK
jgi:DNA-binding Lrp family transcriptional regulator